MAEDLIRYDVLAQEAFRGLVRKVLTEVAHAGLPGDHHFFIAFDTRAPGVRISSRLRERYPEEMTIVLQHQYWDLVVTDHAFEVGLSFSGIPERLLIPFTALKGFFDPSVEFAVTFPLVDENGRPADAPDEAAAAGRPQEVRSGPVAVPALKATESRPALKAVDGAQKPAETAAPEAISASAAGDTRAAEAAGEGGGRGDKGEADAERADADKTDGEKGEGKTAAVVSLDAFRKKP